MEEGETVTCDSCDYPAPVAEFDWTPSVKHNRRPMRLLCEFCSTSMAANHTEFPARDEHQMIIRDIWKAAGSIANFLTKKDQP